MLESGLTPYSTAIISDLAGNTPGFSGITGGLQREWTVGSSDLGDLTVQMYGQLVWPFMGRQVGLMTFDARENATQLTFEGVAAEEGLGEFLAG